MLRNGVMYAHSRDARVAAAAIVDAIVKATAETYGVASGDVRGWLESMREDPLQQRERARRGVLLISERSYLPPDGDGALRRRDASDISVAALAARRSLPIYSYT